MIIELILLLSCCNCQRKKLGVVGFGKESYFSQTLSLNLRCWDIHIIVIVDWLQLQALPIKLSYWLGLNCKSLSCVMYWVDHQDYSVEERESSNNKILK